MKAFVRKEISFKMPEASSPFHILFFKDPIFFYYSSLCFSKKPLEPLLIFETLRNS